MKKTYYLVMALKQDLYVGKQEFTMPDGCYYFPVFEFKKDAEEWVKDSGVEIKEVAVYKTDLNSVN